MTNKKLYKNFCDNNTSIPLFLQPFWLDTIAEKWEVVLVSENDKIKAALPFCVKGNLFTKRIYLPDVNFYQTPVFAENITLNQKQKLTEELFKQLPKTIKSYFKFPTNYNTLDLSKQGFKKETYTTYTITNTIFFQLNKHHQRQIQKGIKSNYKIQKSKNVIVSYQLIADTFLRQKIQPKLSLKNLQQLHALGLKNNCTQILDCLDEKENTLATLLIGEDAITVFYLFGGYNFSFKNSGAMTFLLYHAIQYSLEQQKEFNFCGSSKKSIAEYFEGFGAQPAIIPIWKKTLI